MIQALWSLDQQFQNKNGSILTSGRVYVYYKGRTALATTYNDEDGTVVNPNPILLDNNGRAACFASSSYAYTILVCDAYGKELFSYDLTLHDAVATADKVFVIGSDGSVRVDPTTLPNGIQYDLSVNTDVIATKQSVDDVKDDLDDLSDTVDEHTNQIGELQDDVDDIEDTLANKKDKQEAKSFDGAATKTVKKITQNANGEMNVEFEDIDLPPEVPNVEITSPNGTIDVQSSTDVQTNTKTFTIDVKKGDVDYYIGSKPTVEVGTTNYYITDNLVRAEGNIDISHPGKGLYLVCVNANVRPSGAANEQHEVWLSIGPNNTYTMMHSLDWTNLQDTDISCASIVKINGDEPITITMSYGSTPTVGVDLTICNVSVYRLDSIIGQGSGVSDIVIAREHNGVIDDTYDGVKIRQTEDGNEIVALRKNNSWYSYGQLVPLSAGSNKILITDSNGTIHWGIIGNGLDLTNDVISTDIQVQNADKINVDLDFGNTIQTVNSISTDGSTVRTDGFNFTLPTIKAGDGISFTKVGTETTIAMDSEVGDVVETVEKLKKDLDTQLTVNFDMPGIDNVYDFADTSVVPLANGATMLCQAFTVPINHEIRVDDGVETEPTLLGIYAKQIFAHKIMLALYVYDFETGYTDYVGDTGPVNVAQGRNEYPLKHINPEITELKSSSVYYAALYLPSNAHSNGLYLAGCPSYSNASYINAIPRFTIGVQNIIHNGSEIDMTDATTGRLDFNDGEGNYYIGPWSSSYNEIPAAPRFFMQIRNGEVQEPTVLSPFENITYQSIIRNESAVANDVFSTSDLGSASNPIVFQELTPNTDIDIISCTIYDGNATEAFGNTFAYFSSDFGTRYDVQSTVADASAGYGYSHTYTFATPVHLTAGTTYRWPVGVGQSDYFFALRTYDSSVTNTKVLHLFGSVYNVSQWVNFSRANAGPAVALTLVDSNNTTWNV